MDDAPAMGAIERIHDLAGNAQRLAHRDRSALQTLGQRLALQVLHHEEVGPPSPPAHVVERADVGVDQLRDRTRFALEAFAQHRVVRQVRRGGP